MPRVSADALANADVTSPNINLILPPLDGKNGWYISEVDVSGIATDAISGLDSMAVSMDEGATWNSFPIHISDGIILSLPAHAIWQGMRRL